MRRIRWLPLIGVATVLAACGTGHATVARPTGVDWAYVTSAAGIIPFNLHTHRTGRVITVPSWNPETSVIVAAGGRSGYTTSASGLVPVDLATGDLGEPLPIGDYLQGSDLSSDGQTLWAPDWNDQAGLPNAREVRSIVPIATATCALGRRIPVPGGPVGITISPDGRTAWLITQGGATLTQVTLPLGLVGYVIPVPDGVDALAIAPDGRTAYAVGSSVDQVGSYSDSYVTPVDLVTGVAEAPIILHYDPYGIAVSPDGRTIWVTGGTVGAGPGSRTPDLRSIDLATGRVDGPTRSPEGPTTSSTPRPAGSRPSRRPVGSPTGGRAGGGESDRERQMRHQLLAQRPVAAEDHPVSRRRPGVLAPAGQAQEAPGRKSDADRRLPVERVDDSGTAVDLHQEGPLHRTGEVDADPRSVGHAGPAAHDVAEPGRHLVECGGHVGGLVAVRQAERQADVLFVQIAVVVTDAHEPPVGLVLPGGRPRRGVEVRLCHGVESGEPAGGHIGQSGQHLVDVETPAAFDPQLVGLGDRVLQVGQVRDVDLGGASPSRPASTPMTWLSTSRTVHPGRHVGVSHWAASSGVHTSASCRNSSRRSPTVACLSRMVGMPPP